MARYCDRARLALHAGEQTNILASVTYNESHALVSAVSFGCLLGALACSAGGGSEKSPSGGSGASGGSGSGASGGTVSTGSGATGGTGIAIGGMGGSAGSSGDTDNPATCEQAALNRSYVGCEFWPTITYNPVYTDFDFAVVLANGGSADATVTVTGPNAFTAADTVPAGGLKAILLPWVAALKGPEFSRVNTQEGRAKDSELVAGGAYKLTSTVPVTAWQFNPLQYKKAIGEITGGCGTQFGTQDCYSASNDASLLLPAAAMTNNYRVFTRAGIYGGAPGVAYTSASSGVAITATAAATTVTVQLSPTCAAGVWTGTGGCLAAGTGVTAANANDIVEFTLNAGDVVQLLGAQAAGDSLLHADLSGTVINATSPVQVIGFNPITNVPDVANADHIEETVLPAEVLGKEYLIAPPTTPSGVAKGGHMVRIYGNVDGTTLTYDAKPTGAPDTVNAGDVVEFGPSLALFKVSGSQPFAVGSFMLGGASQGDGACPGYPCSGDPSFSMMVTPEQFRKQYTFLAPTDYDKNFADVFVPAGATVTLDGAALGGTPEAIGGSGWSLVRVALGPGEGGAHRLESDQPIGLQVMGFGHATSYYYPGGLNLKLISEPPVIVK